MVLSDANQEWLRRVAVMRQALHEDEIRLQTLIDTLSDQLHVELLTEPGRFGKVTVDTVIRDGRIIGIDWSISGQVRTPKSQQT